MKTSEDIDMQAAALRWQANHKPVPIDGHEELLRQLVEDLISLAPLQGNDYGGTMLRYVRLGLIPAPPGGNRDQPRLSRPCCR